MCMKTEGKRSPEGTEDARLQVESSASIRLTVDFAKCLWAFAWFLFGHGISKIYQYLLFLVVSFFPLLSVCILV